jgi:hypothetical protein
MSEIGPARTSFRDDGAAITVPNQDGVVEAEMIKRVSNVAGVMVQSSKRMDRGSMTGEFDGVRGDPAAV